MFDPADLNGPAVVLEFGAPWCGPCRALEPVLMQLADELPDIRVISLNLDLDEDAQLARRYNITSAGVVLLLKNGEPVDKIVGAKPLAHIKRLLIKHELIAA